MSHAVTAAFLHVVTPDYVVALVVIYREPVAAEDLEESFFSQMLLKGSSRNGQERGTIRSRSLMGRRSEDGEEMRGLSERGVSIAVECEGTRRLTTGGPYQSWQSRLDKVLARERAKRRAGGRGSLHADAIGDYAEVQSTSG